MIKKVGFISRNMAEGVLPKYEDRASIISINSDNNLAKLDAGWLNKHYVIFSDIDREYPEYPKEKLFNEEQAIEIIKFIDSIKDDTELMFVHCDAGISRSAAVAKFIADIYELPFNHKYSLYNKHVYSTLWSAYRKMFYS